MALKSARKSKKVGPRPPRTGKDQEKRKWTVMVFMAAESVDGFAPLGGMARDDLAEMMKVSSSDALDIFVQLHEDTGARRIHVGRSESEVPGDQRRHENGQALSSFVKWALDIAGPREQDSSMLVVWGHSYQFAVGQVPTPDGRVEALDFAEFADVLQRLQRERNDAGHPGKVVDIIGFDACDLSAVEVALQLQPYADYLLASEMGIPLPGWPYDRVLDRVRDPKGMPMGPAELGSYAVRRYCEAYAAERAVTLTLLQLASAREIVQGVDLLARRLALSVGRSAQEKTLILELFSRSQTDTDKPFVDVADLCLNLMRASDDVELKQAANAVGDLLITPGPVRPGDSQRGTGRAFVAEHARNAARTAKLNGVSLYAPHVAGRHDFEAARAAYGRFTFAEQSLWNRLVHNLAQAV